MCPRTHMCHHGWPSQLLQAPTAAPGMVRMRRSSPGSQCRFPPAKRRCMVTSPSNRVFGSKILQTSVKQLSHSHSEPFWLQDAHGPPELLVWSSFCQHGAGISHFREIGGQEPASASPISQTVLQYFTKYFRNLIFTKALRHRYSLQHQLHFMDQTAMAQRSAVICLSSQSQKMELSRLDPRSMSPSLGIREQHSVLKKCTAMESWLCDPG